MARTKNIAGTSKSGTTLAARFRFHAVEALTADRCPAKYNPLFGKKIRFNDPRLQHLPGCPKCDDDMQVYRRPLGDEWACCPRCGFATDVPGLVAVKLGCTIQDAVDFLIFQHNLHKVDTEEIDHYIAQRKLHEQFACQLRHRLLMNYRLENPYPEHGLNVLSLNRLLDVLDLRQSLDTSLPIEIRLTKRDRYVSPVVEGNDVDMEPPQVWRSPVHFDSDFFGVAHYRTAESWFFPKLIDPETDKIAPNNASNKLFRGIGWDLVLVIPLMDVPGRYCGVICVGREGRYPEDYVVRLFPDENTRSTNTGFILPFHSYRQIVMGQRQEGTHLIAYNNPLHLIRTLLQSCKPPLSMPLIGWIDHFESKQHLKTSDWSPFKNVRKVFWTQSSNQHVTRAAIEQDADVIEYDPHQRYPGTMERCCFGITCFRPTPDALESMYRDARHWTHYLANSLRMMKPETALETLRQIALTPNRFHTCLAQLPRTSQTQAMRKIARQQSGTSHVQVGQYEVFEEVAGLFRKTPRQESATFVTDVRCYLDHLFYNSRRTRKFYRGRIQYEGRTLAFDVAAMDFDKRPIKVVQEAIHKAGLPEPTFRCADRFFKNTVFAMSRLKKVLPIRSLGWSGKTCTFEFPQFRLKHDGVVLTTNRAKILANDFPCKYLTPPELNMEQPALPQDFGPFIPFLAACTHVSLQHMFEYEPRPLVISGGSLEDLKHLAEAMGMPLFSLQNPDAKNVLRKYNKQHRWPIFVPYGLKSDLLKIRGIKPDDFRYTVFYIDDTDKAERILRCNNRLDHVPLQKCPKLDEEIWQNALASIKTLFFRRLRQYILRRNGQALPLKEFMKAERKYWNRYFIVPEHREKCPN